MTTILGHPHGILTVPDTDGHILATAMDEGRCWQVSMLHPKTCLICGATEAGARTLLDAITEAVTP